MNRHIKIGTRESQLAVWQAMLVKSLLAENEIESELVYIKSEGDIDTVTPLYELGIQGIFTKSLDAALLNNQIDIAVHSLKDVPTKLADGLMQAAVLKRASCKDILVFKKEASFLDNRESRATIATSSIRRKAQWLNRYPGHTIENLRGNVNTRLKKVNDSQWNGAIFAAAGLERIDMRPQNSIDLNWMLPAPAQGAIVIVCRNGDALSLEACLSLNDADTVLCTKIERDFLRELMGGCSTPVSALAIRKNDTIIFRGNICSPDGKDKIEIEKEIKAKNSFNTGTDAANELLESENARVIMNLIRNEKK